MPYKSEKIKIQGTAKDRRRKLSEDQKEQIRGLYENTGISIHSLAKDFGVSRRLIQFILFPKREERAKQRFKEHWKEYSDREKLTDAMRDTRRYKQELYLKGILIDIIYDQHFPEIDDDKEDSIKDAAGS